MNENEKIDLGSRNGQRALDEYYGKGAPGTVPVANGKTTFDLPFQLGALGESEIRSAGHMIGISAPDTWGEKSREELTMTVNGLFDEMFMSPEDRAYARVCRVASLKGQEAPERTDRLVADEMNSDDFKEYNSSLDRIKGRFETFRVAAKANGLVNDSNSRDLDNMLKDNAVSEISTPNKHM